MVQRGQDFGLTLKPCQPLRVSRESFGEDLERHLTLELGIGGLVDLSHAALADEGGDVVMAEPGADGERQERSLEGMTDGSIGIIGRDVY